ncbi:hypothetical protein AA0521_3054 [Komagataeibacter intermedius NRIC 0521]|uniref:Uncharacterized protein n=1 Tax=Komagataeibacter intermedius NRIC 0521 TaxID=1307934 RepID=A0ABQ0PPT6_9PROT|nr:hypothetical protein AA0521_3054 [Komagataeibacter intermedius NRIC 0521]
MAGVPTQNSNFKGKEWHAGGASLEPHIAIPSRGRSYGRLNYTVSRRGAANIASAEGLKKMVLWR